MCRRRSRRPVAWMFHRRNVVLGRTFLLLVASVSYVGRRVGNAAAVSACVPFFVLRTSSGRSHRAERRRNEGIRLASTASDADARENSGTRNDAARIHGNMYSSRNSLPYVRIQKRGRHFDVQTAITTFEKKYNVEDYPTGNHERTLSVDLHAQIHFGDSSYYEYFNDERFASSYDKVLYELIVEDKMLSPKSGMRRLTPVPGHLNPISPTAADRATASQYGLQCQVDAINYCQTNWVHADLTREEFLSWMERGRTSFSDLIHTSQRLRRPNSSQRPLWALASTAPAYPGSELLAALLRPPTIYSASDVLARRLFTHLFLPGNDISGWIRAALW